MKLCRLENYTSTSMSENKLQLMHYKRMPSYVTINIQLEVCKLCHFFKSHNFLKIENNLNSEKYFLQLSYKM